MAGSITYDPSAEIKKKSSPKKTGVAALLRQLQKDNLAPERQTFPDAFDLTPPELRFDMLAEAQGVKAIRVERPEQIDETLDLALADDQPFLIDLVLSNQL